MNKENNNYNASLDDLLDIDDEKEVSSLKDLPHANKDENQLDERNEIYTDILGLYKRYLNITLKCNVNMRNSIFEKMISILIIFVILQFVVIIVVLGSKLDTTTTIVSLGTVFASLISSIIIIPTKIAEYTFNKEETTQISSIIKNIQEYDKAIRDDRYKYNARLSSIQTDKN